uniref:Uncharacterized protein n=1 Tax=Pipistrellus kuhlii TaxID=59472 RepID=A0A7J8A8V5_PIPKU|nr:hypothetical protein mPipKuh1_009023 [Pipistrellus kuhlii]
MVPHSSAFGLALPALFSLGPHPTPSTCFLFTGRLPQLGDSGVLGETKTLLPSWTGLEGLVPGALQARHPQPLPPGSLEKTWCGNRRPVLCGGSVISSSSSLLRGLKATPHPPAAVLQSGPCGQDFGVQGRSPSTGVRSQNPKGSQASALNGCWCNAS